MIGMVVIRIAAKSRSGLNFLHVPRACYDLTTERDLIINEIGLYILLAGASGFLTFAIIRYFMSHIEKNHQYNPKICHCSCYAAAPLFSAF